MTRWRPQRCLLVALLGLCLANSAQPQQQTAPVQSDNDQGDLRKAPDFQSNEIYLLEQALKSFRVVQRIDLPNRVYMKKAAALKNHQCFMTGPTGKLGDPQRFLLSGSVVRGDRIGGSRDRYYALTKEGIWRRAEPPEIYQVQDDVVGGGAHLELPDTDEPSFVAQNAREAAAATRLGTLGFTLDRREGKTWASFRAGAEGSVSRQDLASLADINRLTSLSLSGFALNNDHVRCVTVLTDLEYLSLEYTEVTDVGLKELRNLEKLKSLSLAGSPVTDASLHQLRPLQGLESLSLGGARKRTVSQSGLAELASLPRLRWLSLRSTLPLQGDSADRALQAISQLRELEYLDLSYNTITSAGLKEISSLANLRELNLSATNVSDVGITHLRNLSRLENLDLSPASDRRTIKGPVISDAALPAIGQLTALRDLNLSNSRVTDTGLNALSGLVRLESLNFDGTLISDAGLQILQQLPQLRSLSLQNSDSRQMNITPVGIKEFKKARPKVFVDR